MYNDPNDDYRRRYGVARPHMYRRTENKAPVHVGDVVTVAIGEPGPPRPPLCYTRGLVMNSGIEVDVIVSPDYENIEDLAEALKRNDMNLQDIKEGPVYVLRNCQPEDCRIISRP